jgi:hypothetical protein
MIRRQQLFNQLHSAGFNNNYHWYCGHNVGMHIASCKCGILLIGVLQIAVVFKLFCYEWLDLICALFCSE